MHALAGAERSPPGRGTSHFPPPALLCSAQALLLIFEPCPIGTLGFESFKPYRRVETLTSSAVATTDYVADLPADAEKLLAVSPEAFVEQRKLLVRRLRDEGRAEDAQAIARMKKPPPVVLALNRAARDRPQAAKDAADAAERLGPAQLSGDADGYRKARGGMEQASALLAEVAVANLSKGKSASDPMRRRVADLIRGALAAEDTRQQLIRGVLVEEVEAQGFDAFRGLTMPAQSRKRVRSEPSKSSERKRRAREELEAEIEETTRLLKDAEKRVRDLMREQETLAKTLASLEDRRDRAS